MTTSPPDLHGRLCSVHFRLNGAIFILVKKPDKGIRGYSSSEKLSEKKQQALYDKCVAQLNKNIYLELLSSSKPDEELLYFTDLIGLHTPEPKKSVFQFINSN